MAEWKYVLSESSKQQNNCLLRMLAIAKNHFMFKTNHKQEDGIKALYITRLA